MLSADRHRDQAQAAKLRAARGLALDVSLAEIVRALASAGVQPLLIKGPAHARWLYDDPAERRYGDLDLLVAPGDFERACGCVLQLGFNPVTAGFRPHETTHYHERFVRGGPLPAVVELHRTLSLLAVPATLVWQCLSEGTRTIEVAGAPVRVPRAAASAVIVGLHAAHHGIREPGPIRELERAVDRVDEDTWRAAAMIAHKLGAAPAFAAGLCLTPEGRALAEQLGVSAHDASRLVRLHTQTPPATALGIEQLFTTQGLRGRVSVLARKLAPSPPYMQSVYPLARRGRLGLLLSYMLRPVVLAVKLPRGMAAWLKAARHRTGQKKLE
jgi:Uncharacterised nucleotidyltransferase